MTIPNPGKVINTLKTVFPNGEHLGKIKAQRKKLNTPAILTALALSDADEGCTVDSNEAIAHEGCSGQSDSNEG